MSKKSDTWMPLYVADYLADTSHLNTEQHGAYFLMLMAAWKRGGSLPHDESQLVSICRLSPAKWKAYRAVLLDFFEDTGASYTHNRVLSEYRKANALNEKKAVAGAEGAAKRWGNQAKKDGKNIADPLADPLKKDGKNIADPLADPLKKDGKNIADPLADPLKKDGKNIADPLADQWQTDAPARVFLPSPIPTVLIHSEDKSSGGEPPPTDREIVFSTGVPLITAAGVKESNARSMLAMLCKKHGEPAVVEAISETARSHAGDPVSWLQAILKPKPPVQSRRVDAPAPPAWEGAR